MFPTRLFPDRYFAPRYFPKVGAEASADTAPIVCRHLDYLHTVAREADYEYTLSRALDAGEDC